MNDDNLFGVDLGNVIIIDKENEYDDIPCRFRLCIK